MTRMPPRGPTSRPASTASLFSGRTPTPRTTSWAGSRWPDFSRTTRPSRAVLERLGGLAEQQRHALARQLLSDGRRHLLVERRQHLVLQLDHRGCDAPAHEVLDQFQADEARPDDDRLLHALVHAGLDAVHVLQVPQGEDAGQVDAGQRRAQRCRSRSEDQLVVGLLVLPPRSEVTDIAPSSPPGRWLPRRSAPARRG